MYNTNNWGYYVRVLESLTPLSFWDAVDYPSLFNNSRSRLGSAGATRSARTGIGGTPVTLFPHPKPIK